MKVLVTIPLGLYRVLESRCRTNTPEFKLLTSGVVQEDRVVIRCENAQASSLRAWANASSPGAAREITIVGDAENPSA